MRKNSERAENPRLLASAEAEFLRLYPAYQDTRNLDDLREREYARLDRQGHAYLDYTGGGLYAESQVHEHVKMLTGGVFGNPHSINPTSLASTEKVEKARAFVLEYFNASADEYAAIFTPNASGALKLVGEAYPFNPDSRLMITFDNHNSVNGIREFARHKGARLTYLPIRPDDLRIDPQVLDKHLEAVPPGAHALYAFPAQSNFSGVQHSLDSIDLAHARGWDVIADCAAFVPSNRLDLSRYHPDFVPLSFYKMFGYPTGMGCLLARREALRKLHRPWFSGGAVFAVSVRGDAYHLAEGEAGFEDGTVDYLGIPAVEIGLRHLLNVGLESIHSRVICLTGWLLEALLALRHDNGEPLVRIYGPRDTHDRGGTIAMNLLDPGGKVIDERVVEQAAMQHKISIRTGCFCNPGAGETTFGLSPSALESLFVGSQKLTYDEYLQVLGLPTSGALRVSLGIVSNFNDVYRLVEMIRSFLNLYPDAQNLQPRSHC